MVAKTLSKSDIKTINEELQKLYDLEFFNKKDFVQLVQEQITYLRSNKDPVFFYHGDVLVPFLKLLLKDNFLKKITVDMGAVKFVCNGADIMRPGIVNVDVNILKDEFMAIIDENNSKPLAVGQALFSGGEISDLKEGKVIKNIHFIGDDKWSIN